MAALVAAEGAAILLLGVLVAGLLRSHAEIVAKLHAAGIGTRDPTPPGVATSETGAVAAVRQLAPPRGEAAPVVAISGVTPFDEAVSISVANTRVDTLLAFLSGTCSTCTSLWSGLREGDSIDAGLPDRTRLVVVTLGPGEESPSRLRRVAAEAGDVAVVMSSDAWQDYKVPGAPYFIWVSGSDGRVTGEGSASTWQEVASLMADASGDGVPDTAGRREAAGAMRSTARRREDRVDAELAAAGIGPGDPRLYHEPRSSRQTGAASPPSLDA